MGRPHGPAQLRAFLRLLKDHQGPLDTLLLAARDMEDPAHGARALAALVKVAPPPLRRQAEDSLAERLHAIRREAQVAETVADVLRQVGGVTDAASLRRLVEPLIRLPDGEALSHGIRGAAKVAPEPLRALLFERAVGHRGQETADAKAVLRAAFRSEEDLVHADGWRVRIGRIQDSDLRVRLLAFLHHQVSQIDLHHPAAHASFQDAVQGLRATTGTDARRADLWRTVARDAARLQPLLDAAQAEPPAMQAEALLAIGAQADRRGDQALAASAFDAAEALLPQVGPDERLAGKVQAARSRLKGTAPFSPPRPTPAATRDLPSSTGHALGLCNTYTGGIKEIHFRAVARAAPLCAAFGLDLVLLGFPVPLEDLVARTARETRIGGEPWILRLHEAGRVQEGPLDPSKALPAWERYTWLAASEQAPADRQVALEDVAPHHPVCLVMGVGPQGLPKRLRHACQAEYEITGHGIGLETATAMGILADRLARAAGRQ